MATQLKHEKLIQLFHALNGLRTAPYQEHWIADKLDMLLQNTFQGTQESRFEATIGLELETDQWGNRIARIGRKKFPRDSPLVFVTNLDHPGFTFPPYQSGIRLEAYFEGAITEDYLLGAEVRVFCSADDSGTIGIVTECSPPSNKHKRIFLVIEVQAPVVNPVLAMWNLNSVGADDLQLQRIACGYCCRIAALLSALDYFSRAPEKLLRPITMIFTRAKEAGFSGSLCLLKSEERLKFLPVDAKVFVLESIPESKTHPLGQGAIMRIGDQVGSFSHQLINQSWYSLTHLEASKQLPLKRAFLEDSLSEATAFLAAGYQAASLCIPTRHWQNQNLQTGELDEEIICIQDFVVLVKLIQQLAQQKVEDHPTLETEPELLQHLEKGLRLLTKNDLS
ncbi:MAG: hypothetical protein ACFCU1_10785 [Sumerlaeia bacterium]